MHSHVVLYTAYKHNLAAADSIVTEATRLLSNIPGIVFFHAAKIFQTGRAVSGDAYDVMLNIVFKDTEHYEAYMTYPQHMDFVRFVLKGYMLAGSDSSDPEQEFIDYILRGGESRKWARNPDTPDKEVVWGGEAVFDASSLMRTYDPHRAIRQLERALPGITERTPFPRD